MCSAPGAFVKAAGTTGYMKSGCLTAVGRAGGGMRRAQPAAIASSSTVATSATWTGRLESARINDIFLRRRRGEPLDEPPRDVGLDDDPPVGLHMADHAGDPVQACNLLSIEVLAAVEGNRDPPRVEREP